MRLPALAWRLAWVLAIAGCGTRPIPEPEAHLRAETEAARGAAPYIPETVSSVPLLTSATLPAVALIRITPEASGVGSGGAAPAPADSWTR